MARVLIATQPWGVITNPYGDPQAGMAVSYTLLDGVTAVARFAGSTGGTTTSLPTDSDGIVPGYMDIGSYLMTAGGVTRQVEAVSGVLTGLAGPLSLANSSSSHAAQITNNTTGDSSSEALDVISNNEDDTCFGLRGVEKGRGTIKATHLKPPSGADDANASVLSLRINGAGTAAQGIFVDSEDGATTGKLINWRQAGIERFVLGADGDIITGGNNLNDFFLRRRAAWLATMPDLLAQAQSNLVSGTVYAGVAFALKAGTYTAIRFMTSGTVPAGLTDVRMGVWSSANALLGSTANIATAVGTAGANAIVEQPLAAGVTLTENQQVYLGIGWTGTTLGVRGAALAGAILGTRTGRTFGESRTASGYAGGGLPVLTAGTSGIFPWLELI